MCDFSKREAAMVTVRPNVHCDPCLVPLVRALYENGFPTVASCCGHGNQPANVALADGREVFVADPEWAETIWAAIAAKRPHQPQPQEEMRGAEVALEQAAAVLVGVGLSSEQIAELALKSAQRQGAEDD